MFRLVSSFGSLASARSARPGCLARAKCAFCVERSKIALKFLLRKGVVKPDSEVLNSKARAFARISHGSGSWIGERWISSRNLRSFAAQSPANHSTSPELEAEPRQLVDCAIWSGSVKVGRLIIWRMSGRYKPHGRTRALFCLGLFTPRDRQPGGEAGPRRILPAVVPSDLRLKVQPVRPTGEEARS